MGSGHSRRHLWLIGFSMGGKSTVGRRVANRLDMPFADSDHLVEQAAGRSVAEIFATNGETAFRRLEGEALVRVAGGQASVVATGGGVVLSRENRRLMHETGVVITLQAQPDTIIERLHLSVRRKGAIDRPLLAKGDPAGEVRRLTEQRRHLYAMADWTVQTDHLELRDVVAEVVRGWRYCQDDKTLATRSWRDPDDPHTRRGAGRGVAAVVDTGGERYEIRVEPGLLDRAGEAIAALRPGSRAFVIGDDTVQRLFAARLGVSLASAGITSIPVGFPAGEEHKTLATTERVYDQLLAHRVERRDVVVALGGGVSGDLAGYVAATILRGVALVHIPTSLLAMVDSSIGGKTGVDHPSAKNMIGAFHQPLLVLCDPDVLGSLPERHYRAGWAEVIKHGLILDRSLVAALEGRLPAIGARDPAVVAEVIAWSARIKADVVSQDERESSVRTLLNYGHTVGHALETVNAYSALLHGEAVAIGMQVAARLSHDLGLLSADDLARQTRVIAGLGLPTVLPSADRAALHTVMARDKKVADGVIRWVVLESIGHAIVQADVPVALVDRALDAVTAA